MSDRSDRTTGARPNDRWGVRAKHALYIHDGHWYHSLKRFPGALFDQSGYILFQTEAAFRNCSHLTIHRGGDVSVPKPGISALPGYVRVVDTSARSAASPPEEVSTHTSFAEGSVVRIHVNRYERDERARECAFGTMGRSASSAASSSPMRMGCPLSASSMFIT